MDGFTAVKTRHHYVMSGGQVSKGETVLGCREASEVHLAHKNQTFTLTICSVSASAGLHMPITVLFVVFFFSRSWTWVPIISSSLHELTS